MNIPIDISFDYRVLNLLMYQLTGQQVPFLFVHYLQNYIPTSDFKIWDTFLCCLCLFFRSMNCIWTSCQYQNFWLRYLMTCEYALKLTLTHIIALLHSLHRMV